MIGDGGRRSRRRCWRPLPLALSVAMPATIPATTARPLRPAYPITASCGGHRRDGTWLDRWRCLGLNCPFPLVFQGCSVQSLGRQCAWRALGSVARDAFQTIPRRPACPTHRLLGIAPNAPESTRMRWFRLGQKTHGKGTGPPQLACIASHTAANIIRERSRRLSRSDSAVCIRRFLRCSESVSVKI
jgi:hypothetical protein